MFVLIVEGVLISYTVYLWYVLERQWKKIMEERIRRLNEFLEWCNENKIENYIWQIVDS